MKNKKLFIAGLSSVAILALASCQPHDSSSDNTKSSDSTDNSSVVVDKKVASIAIVENSIKKSYSVGDKASYASLAINTLNAAKEVISTLKATDNATTISYTNIDTTEVTEGKTFTVTYKDGDNSFTDSLTYTVAAVEYELTNWMPNKGYTETVSTVANSKLSISEDSPESGFIAKDKYYVGNDNAVDLLPIMTAINPNNPLDTTTIDTIPGNVTVSLLDKDDKAIKVEDYIENVSELKSKGLVQFKDDVIGDFTLTFTSPDQEQPIKYEICVVEGYNVTSAKDCFAIDTATYKFYDADLEKMKEWKKEQGIPYANGLVFQKDVTINKSDLPSFYFWGDEATSAKVKGSLKDWAGLFDYKFEKEGKVTIYGNNHRMMLNDDSNDADAFPLIITDSRSGEEQEANKPISTHASIFYIHEADGIDPNKCVFSIQNLEFSGNNGVSKESSITEGGPMFLKAKTSAKMKNVNVSKTYMAVMADNSGDITNDTTVDVENCRFRDLANSAIYVYRNGTVNIKNSDLMTAGGPLLFLNSGTQKLPTFTGDVDAYASAIDELISTNVNIDDKTFLSNFTEGKGGWFAAYSGAESYASNIKSMAEIFKGQFAMDFLKNDTATNVSKFNFVSFVLPTSSGEGLGLDTNNGGINASIKIGDELVYSTLDGAKEVATKALVYQAATASGDQSAIQAAGLAYVDALSSTDFGNGLTFAGINNAVTFKKYDKDGKANFGLMNFDGTNYWVENTKYTILKTMGYDDDTLAALGVSKLVGDAFKNEGYISASINSVSMAGSPTEFTKFEGVCNYGLLLGNYKSAN